MKIAWLIASLLLLADRGGSVSAARASGAGLRKLDDEDAVLVTNATGFRDAIRNASPDPMNPSTIFVDIEAVIDFDDASLEQHPDGIFMHNKYFEAICVGYDENNKCTLERSVGDGRLFRNYGPSTFSFKGFQFKGGDAFTASLWSLKFGRRGGVFALHSDDEEGNDNIIEATFADCDFISNSSPDLGGAIFATAQNYGSVSLIFHGCFFQDNLAGVNQTNDIGEDISDGRGGAIFAAAQNYGKVNLIIQGCFFQDNLAGANEGMDIGGRETSDGGQVLLSCSETTTTLGMEVDVAIDGDSSQTACSATAFPTSAPSTEPSTSNAPSTAPTSAPSAASSRFQGWETITYDNFEDPDNDGWGNFRTSTDDNELAIRVDSSIGSDFIPNGNAALRIEDDRGWRSLVFHRKSHDVRGYSKLRVRFWYKSEGMEPGDSFVLEYSRSPGYWKVMKRFVRGENFDNGELKRRTIDFDDTGKNYGLTSQAKIRFRLDDASPNDFIYIDEVTFQGYVE